MSTTPTKKKWIPWLIAGIIIAIAVTAIVLYLRNKKMKASGADTKEVAEQIQSSAKVEMKPSNVKNNNPGNIRISTQAWKGKIPNSQNTDKRFEQFTEKVWGVRAMTRIVKGWIDKGKANTIASIITKYAPASENDTTKYIDFVAKQTGIVPNQTLNSDKKTLKPIILAMAQMEQGKGAVTASEFDQAWKVLA